MVSLEESIKNKIEAVKPKPKWSFIVKILLKDLLLFIVLFLAIILFSFIFNIFEITRPWENLSFNRLHHELIALPWELIIFFIALVSFAFTTLRKTGLSYRLRPALITVLVIFFCSGGYLLAKETGVTNSIDQTRLAGAIYRQEGRLLKPERGPVLAGTIQEYNNGVIKVKDSRGKEWDVKVDSATKFSNGKPSSGDHVILRGQKKNSKIDAFGIRKLEENKNPVKNGLKRQPFYNVKKQLH